MSNGKATPNIDLGRGVEVVPASGAPVANKEVPAQYTPIGNLVAGWAEPPPTETKAGLIIGEEASKQFATPVLRVVAIGPDVKQVKVGDRVLVNGSSPVMKIIVANLASVVVPEDRICGVLFPADANA